MGRLAGFKYRQIVKRLKQLGFVFDRQAAGSHEIWYNPDTNRYTTIPNHPGDMRRYVESDSQAIRPVTR
jgi:predicted RNA binding protein YcfA (HicA-like mRNA interferase family)